MLFVLLSAHLFSLIVCTFSYMFLQSLCMFRIVPFANCLQLLCIWAFHCLFYVFGVLRLLRIDMDLHRISIARHHLILRQFKAGEGHVLQYALRDMCWLIWCHIGFGFEVDIVIRCRKSTLTCICTICKGGLLNFPIGPLKGDATLRHLV